MKKNFLFMAAVVFGILVAFSSCKDNKRSSDDDDDDDEKTEKVDKKKTAKDSARETLTKVSSAADLEELEDVDFNDVDLSDFNLNDIDVDNLDINNLSKKEAETLLNLVVTVGNRDMLPMELEQNMTMSRIALDGNDVRFDIDFNCSDLGIGMSDFKMAMGMDEVKNQLIAGMFSEMNEGMEVMMKAIIASNKHFCVNFIDRESGESAKIRLTNSELKQLF